MGDATARPAREVKSADELEQELTQDDDKSVLCLHNWCVKGDLILKHHVIERPIEIVDCEFEGDVDLRYCEFKQVVNLSGCTFQQEFNSGDEVESHTVYKKDLICNKATFVRTARFNGIRVEGSAYFLGAVFQDCKLSVDFVTAFVEKGLELDNAAFEGPVLFQALKCNGYGSFDGACFSVDNETTSQDEIESREADFTFASFGLSLFCRSVTFERPVKFTGLKCDGHGFFDGTTFEAEVDFFSASFGVNLECVKTTFEGYSSFNGIECGGTGFFHQVEFQGGEKIDFSFASFGINLECHGALFEGEAIFNSIECGGNGFFCVLDSDLDDVPVRRKSFEAKGQMDLTLASFGKDLICDGASFDQKVHLTKWAMVAVVRHHSHA